MFPSEKSAGEVARRPDLGGRSTIYGTRGAVACEHAGAALAGIRVLDAGGNAADACVAMAASMAVLAPMATGLGGDAFLLFYEAETGSVLGANCSGRAPGAATIEKLRERGYRFAQRLPRGIDAGRNAMLLAPEGTSLLLTTSVD